MSDTAHTAEGRLIRYHMAQARPKLTDMALAERLGWTRGKVNMATLGRTRARRGKPPQEYHPSDADLVRIAREVGIKPEELDGVGRGDAAERLRSETPPPEPQAIGRADFERLFYALTYGRPDAKMLQYLAHATRGDGEPLPFGERVDLIINWLQDQPSNPSQEGLRVV